MSGDIHYPDHFIDRLEIVWGDGFLSPGGRDEVAEIVTGLDLAGCEVLDIGFGAGGPALVLAGEFGARVTGIDVEPQLLDRARERAECAGLEEAVDLRLVEPRPLPFDDAAFDVVFSKDSLIHIPDKLALYAEVLRVLRPGGVFAASDWLAHEMAGEMPEFQKYMELKNHLDFAMATPDETAAVMRTAGFQDVSTRDRNAWYAVLAEEEARQVAGPLREQLVEAAGEEIYAHWVKVRRGLADATKAGGLRPTHLRGKKPDN